MVDTPANTLVPRMLIRAGRISTLLLQLAALGLLALLLVKAIVDVDNHFDSWWYHLPWAARLVGLVPADAYLFEPIASARFEGFPVLPELLQGVIWRISGRVESANLVNYGSLVAFILFLRHFFRVPWWLAVPALLAVPLVQGHATSTYVDLIANLAMAALVLLTYQLYVRPKTINKALLTTIAMSAFVAANSKLQLIPLVALTLAFSAYPVGKWARAYAREHHGILRQGIRITAFLIIVVAIFWVPIKNLAQHGNPVYPLQVTILGNVLNHAEAPPPKDLGGGRLADMPQAGKWFYSVFEIGMGPMLSVERWTVDSAAPAGSPLGIQGGLFGIYVVFNLLLFAWLVSRIDRSERIAAVILVILVTAVAALMPASHLLRYYMFWFISVISLNLHFLASHGTELVRWIVGATCFAFVLFVVDATDQNFVHPRFHSSQDLLAERVDHRILGELKQSGAACLALDWANQPFLYASIWHPGSNHSIKAGTFLWKGQR